MTINPKGIPKDSPATPPAGRAMTGRQRDGAAGVGLVGLALFVTVTLGALKLMDLIEITWLVVLAPTLIVLSLGVLGVLLAMALVFLVALIAAAGK